uniref:uncharacterized protein LOC122587884 n=1 Tax=Erigeron canadensis TaxID=72917 RepID=UPI001CB8DB47|nr:uncharacterized protein LOC122587884 [Erigeron canadensis]
MLMQQIVDRKLQHETLKHVATLFSVSKRTISRIWHDAKLQLQHGSLVDVSSKMANVVGRKRIQIDYAQVSQIPLRRRTNIRSIAKAIDVSKSTMHRRIKEGALRPHTNAIKPDLTDDNKKARLEFCLSTPPLARPRFDASGNEVFSRKIGIFPFTTLEPAKRSSKNRVAGTLITKPVLSVTKEVTRSWLIEKVLPAIRSKWPRDHTGPIFIQQDNAKPHIDVNDAEFNQEASKDGFDIRICFQPPNSPDLNVLDLGFFQAIQPLQEQEVLGSIDELVSAVKTSFEGMPSNELNNVFLTLQTCMKEIMKVRGGNNYQTPHIGKGKLERQGKLPLTIECDGNLINDVLSYLGPQTE